MAAFDLVVVGAGIVGLAHALAAARRGLKVAVVDREARASGASVQNFGFITVTGQAEGVTRGRALRSREVWLEIAAPAGIAIEQRGALILAQRIEALAVLEEFAATPMGADCKLLTGADVNHHHLPAARVRGALSSPHEIRIEAADALGRLAGWLESTKGVRFFWGRAAHAWEGQALATSEGRIEASACVFAPGSGAGALFPELARRAKLRYCMLQMLRVRPEAAASPLRAVAMGDLSLIRYEGFAAQPSAPKLRARLEHERAEHLAAGVHVIAARSADGSLVVGDSHRYGDVADNRSEASVESLILDEMRALIGLKSFEVVERWVGVYAVADVKPVLRETLGERARGVVVTNGLGMSTAFAIGEETVGELFA